MSPTDRHDEVRFDVQTNTPASVKIWMSTSEPGWIDGNHRRSTFEQIFVQWDGDPKWGGLDRGELSFSWGFYDGSFGSSEWYGSRSEEKMDGGTTVIPEGPYAERWQDARRSQGPTDLRRDGSAKRIAR